MLNVGKIEEGFVLDHIKAGKSLSIYEHLQLDKLVCTVAIIKNARSGKLGKIVGFPFTDRVINKKVCRFTGLEFRRIDRENFFTYVFVERALTTAEGLRIWKGYIELWCGFEDAFTCTI